MVFLYEKKESKKNTKERIFLWVSHGIEFIQ
jgi:hypothetical protein